MDESRHDRGKRGMPQGLPRLCRGVGKTYTMLCRGAPARSRGEDIVIGYVEPHLRPDTMALVEGLDGRAAQADRRTTARCSPSSTPTRSSRATRHCARRRARAHQRPRHAAREAVAVGRGAARRRHQRALDRQRPALRDRSTTWSARSPACASARRCRTGSSTRPTRSSSSTCRPTRCSTASSAVRSTRPTRSTRRSRNFFRRGNLVALRELSLAQDRRGGRRRPRGVHRAPTTSTRRGGSTDRVLVAVTAAAGEREADPARLPARAPARRRAVGHPREAVGRPAQRVGAGGGRRAPARSRRSSRATSSTSSRRTSPRDHRVRPSRTRSRSS